MQEPNDTPDETRWARATLALRSEPPPGLDALFEPPPVTVRDEMISRVLRRRHAASARPSRRWTWLSAAAGGIAVAAALLLWSRAAPDVGPLSLEMQAGNSEVRGPVTDTSPDVLLELRNEPVWTIRLDALDSAAAVELYLVARHADGTIALLDPKIERQGAAFRVRSELGELGLHAGSTTLYFLVGPRDSAVEAVRQVHVHLAGEQLPGAWSVVTTQVQIRG